MKPQSDHSRLSIITVTHNSGAMIGECLKSVERVLGDSADAVVVDNASTDDSLEIVGAATPWVRKVALSENVGFGRACNRGVAETDSDWLLFMNPDVRLTSLMIPDVGERGFGVGACLMSSSEASGPAFMVRSEFGAFNDLARETFARFLPPAVTRHWLWRRAAEWASGALMLVRRGEFARVGEFDERFFLYYEDRDLCRRFRQQDLPIRFVPGIAGIHAAGRSTTAGRNLRQALSLAAWLEYTGIWRGQIAADAAAKRALLVLHAFARTLGTVPWSSRAHLKAREAVEILGLLQHLDAHLPATEQPVLPHARHAIARTVRAAGIAVDAHALSG